MIPKLMDLFLRERLPHYMVPSAITFLPSLLNQGRYALPGVELVAPA